MKSDVLVMERAPVFPGSVSLATFPTPRTRGSGPFHGAPHHQGVARLSTYPVDQKPPPALLSPHRAAAFMAGVGDLSPCPGDQKLQPFLSTPDGAAASTTACATVPSRIFVCELCDASFGSQGGLKSHMNCIHLKKFLYICTVCDKGFAIKEHYNDHMNMHNNIQAHKCPVCNRPFTFKTSLRKHLRDRVCCKLKSELPQNPTG